MEKVKIPQGIRIGSHFYKIIFKDFLKVDENFVGTVNKRTQIIEIESTLPQSRRDVTLLHEIFHIINDNYGCGLDEDNLDRLAEGMAEFLVNNLGLDFDWDLIKKEQ